MHDTVALERRGTPAICIVSTEFTAEAAMQARLLGCPDARTVVIQHPLSTVSPAEVKQRAEAALQQIERIFQIAGET